MALFLPDANVLIHALREASEAHAPCRRWLLKTTEARDSIGLCEIVEAALLRIPTLPPLNLVPMPEVLGFWKDDLWSYPGTCRLGAGARQMELFAGFVATLELKGNDINDAWLAALAMEHAATLVSTDHGFSRFPGLARINPVDHP